MMLAICVFPSPLWGGPEWGSGSLSEYWEQDELRHLATPTPNPSPQGGGEISDTL
jgi:hypothetical protein